MGNHKNITYDMFPRQGEILNMQVKVCFHYGKEIVKGKVIRNDIEDPFKS